MSEEQENFSEEIEDPVREANWFKVVLYTYLQVILIYGVVTIFTQAYYTTTFYCFFLIYLGFIGVNAGAHRLWAHNSYTATTRLKVFLMLCQTLVGQCTIYDWVLYHRLHHKHFKTDQDPFNPSKGFFHAHFFSLVQKPSNNQEELLKQIDMSDLEKDGVVMFQKNYYWLLCLSLLAFTSLYIPCCLWNESLLSAVFVAGCLRFGVNLHLTWLIHSATTLFALKKGESYPADTNLVFLWDKTYWLHYHYLTPWDYQTGEYGNYGDDQISALIRVFVALEFASNLRTTSTAAVQQALYASLKTKKHISECLLETEVNGNIPPDHYLNPKKYY
ncbi:hypothetical protein ILUMI_07093 [Ignelater luminosus]|uniref:Uncharacterized protein n=1 Tax=Ignelater luminosus TaxID=2038154 RepID=A0A8K0GEQ6_IGNLU|nr:hypothetical protein ILUMI_07093 [Ignelater luminosus]